MWKKLKGDNWTNAYARPVGWKNNFCKRYRELKGFLLQIFSGLFLFQLLNLTRSQWRFKDLIYGIFRPGRVFEDHSTPPSHLTWRNESSWEQDLWNHTGRSHLAQPSALPAPSIARVLTLPAIKFVLPDQPEEKRPYLVSPCVSPMLRAGLDFSPFCPSLASGQWWRE